MALATQALRMLRDRDPRGRLIEKIEAAVRPWGIVVDPSIKGIDRLQPLRQAAGLRVFGPDCLIAIYDRSGQYSAGKVLVPDSYLEDKVQGKVAMLCGIGPLCKGQEYLDWFDQEPLNVGDWVITSIKEGFTFLVGDVVFKQIEWKYLRLATLEPDMVM